LIEELRGAGLGGGATIYDVAARAGVSISTVSLAINAPGRVRPATLERVMSVIDALRYVPRSHAVARDRRGVGRIGVVAPFTTSSSYGRLLNGILDAVRPHPFEIAVFHEDPEVTSELLRLPRGRPHPNRRARRRGGASRCRRPARPPRPAHGDLRRHRRPGGRRTGRGA